ncbi:MAG: cytochrome c3 family protein [Acidobacteriaceae bacterium]|nr:cytochrome c3 family protein [Acidobacteriaceae bacterium]MBV8571212.1 cytochrome c3 family protein [Acidobacteriaceae bacterium]
MLRTDPWSEGLPKRCARITALFLLHAALSLAAVNQPVQFPHNTHMKLGLACVDCHTGADIRAAAGIPSVTKCMLCHAKLATNKPEVKKVIQYAQKGEEIPWRRVYGFSSDAHVKFRHAPHFEANISCATCHGEMSQETVAVRSIDFTMGTCLTCHRQRKASQDCAACHY